MFRLVMVLLLAGLLMGSGCGNDTPAASQPQAPAGKSLVLYSELDNKFTQDLVDAFNKDSKQQVVLQAVYELKADAPAPDLVLAEQRTLHNLKLQQRLKPVAFAAGDRLPKEFRDEDLTWYGVFYDPAVLLVNQQFARVVGQSSLYGWTDLENSESLRIAVENLSDSPSTQNFLSALADHYGETTSLNYLWNINRFVGQYSKFPFTPIRMTAVGDADVAITRQSYVFKYLENKFPAYVVIPREGTPVNLFGVGMLQGGENDIQALSFMEWLLVSEQVQAIAQADATGYLFLFPRGIEEAAVDPSKLWLNKSYLTLAEQEALTAKWLERVRFSK